MEKTSGLVCSVLLPCEPRKSRAHSSSPSTNTIATSNPRIVCMFSEYGRLLPFQMKSTVVMIVNAASHHRLK